MNSISERMKNRLEDELMALARKAMSERNMKNPVPQMKVNAKKELPKNALEKAVQNELIGLLSKLLKLSEGKIDVDENVANYGMDSLVITEFIKRVSEKYTIQLQATIFFEARNIKRLASIICARYEGQVEALHVGLQTNESSPQEEELIEVSDFKEDELLEKYRRIFSRRKTIVKEDKNETEGSTDYEPIAIIGVDGMFAKSDSPEALWNNLKNEEDCIEEIPQDRWDWKEVHGDPQKGNKTNVKWGGFIPEIDQFDPAFFNISPKEAELMDPQHRLFIQSVWKSIYRSGYSTKSISGKKIGLFLGVNLQDYQMKLHKQELDAMTLTAAHHVFCPSRIAFLLNIKGPCQVVDTACSSSLVAIHRAILAIQNEGCEMAIAGGANVMMDPMMHIQYAKTGMICEDGRCKSFSDEANGYVRGDGVGSVLLKKLSAAERDNDHIIGVIKGSAENHGGTSASLTAPNPIAQADLIKEAVRNAGIDPRTIGYIESHGTGTALGDPIEINGIKTAFADLFEEHKIENPPSNYCKIGSVKSNIGHAETAAGMAGLIKVLFSMKHDFIPKSLHSDTINPLIDLDGSPFSIAQTGTAWKNIELNGIKYPKTAGISSFGAGGANAHLIVEEYKKVKNQPKSEDIVIVPFSAKSEKSLVDNVKAVRNYITIESKNDASDLNACVQRELINWLANQLKIDVSEIDSEVAFSDLNIQRYDLVLLSVFLSEKWKMNDIESFVIEEDSLNSLVIALTSRFSSQLSAIYSISSIEETLIDIDLGSLALTLQQGRDEFNCRVAFVVQSINDLHKQLGLYLEKEASSARFEGNTKKEKIDFLLEGKAGKSYIEAAIEHKELNALAQLWVKGIAIDWSLLASKNAHKIELPSYQFAQKRYWIDEIKETTLIRETELLTPLIHRNTSDFTAQKFQSTFTGQEDFLSDHKVQELETLPGVAYIEMARSGAEIALKTPVTGLRDIVWLTPIQIKEQSFEVTTHLVLDQNEVKYEIGSKEKSKENIHSQGKIINTELAPISSVDLDALKHTFSKEVSSEMAYQEFKQRGLNYGKSFQGIQELHFSDTEALARISVATDSTYILAPGVLDSALQSCMGVNFELNNKSLELPFSIKSLNIYGSLTEEVWCYTRLSKVEGGLKEYDLDLLDTSGNVLVQIQGFVAVSIAGGKVGKKESTTHYYTSTWSEEEGKNSAQEITSTDQIVLIDFPTDFAAEIGSSKDWSVDVVKKQTPHSLFEKIKEKIAVAIQSKAHLNLTIVGRSDEYDTYGFLRGLIKSAAQEYPQFTGRIVGVESETCKASSTLIKYLEAEVHASSTEIKYEVGKRNTLKLNTIIPVETEELEIRENGVYLITGGVGGLGLLFAEHLSKQTSGKIILTGRSELNMEKQTQVDRIANAVYLSSDVTNHQSVESLVNTIQTKYGKLNGILHGAGVLRDRFLIDKTREDSKEVFGPKVTGLELLDKVTASIELDFLFCFSSVSAILGNVGQTDYSAANAFMDDYIIHRNKEVAQGRRFGKTFSINWPLWRSGGMQIDPSSEQYLKRHWGMEPLPTKEGMEAFDTMLHTNLSSFGVVFGNANELEKRFFNRPTAKVKSTIKTIEKSEELEKQVELEIMTIAANVLKLDMEEMEADVELGDFGFDSISLTQFSNALNENYDLNLVPTVFYNYPTIGELVTFFMDEHLDKVGQVTEVEQEEEQELEIPIVTSLGNDEVHRFMNPKQVINPLEVPLAKETEVAIVGMTGRLPGADTLEEYWENLVNEKDSIQEVPANRWNWKAYYGDPHKEKNKTKSKHGGFINDIDKFDALFFNISPHEAELMDPQQRITLEQVYHLFENAGISTDDMKGTDTGVFVGVSSTDYSTLLKKHADVVDEAHFSTGYSHAVLANRISYLFDLHGPSEPIDTACSSSLVAIHRAVENIKSGNCTMAIAGGVNALIAPDLTLSFSQAGMLSEDGRCKTFDEKANGYVRGEGVGLILLKSLKQAEEDGDQIYGIIKGSNENHGGKANTLTSPNPKAQKALLVKAYTKAGINPMDVSYIEAHGTGTPLGDPIETEALKLAFKEIAKNQKVELPKEAFCKLGSVKTNIGHLESAAGIAGVLKVLLGLKNNQLPGNPQLNIPNEYLALENSPFELLKNTESWQRSTNKPRTAGISSFGFGGANAHIIVQEYLNKDVTLSKDEEVLICLSAKTKKQLEQQKKNYLEFLRRNEDVNLPSLAYSLHVGREQMKYRWSVKAKKVEDVIQSLIGNSEANKAFQGQVQKLSPKSNELDIAQLTKDKNLKEIGQAWVQGISVNWKELYKSGSYKKLQLPPYPFEKNRYWIPNQKVEMETTKLSAFTEPKDTRKLHPLLHQIK